MMNMDGWYGVIVINGMGWWRSLVNQVIGDVWYIFKMIILDEGDDDEWDRKNDEF